MNTIEHHSNESETNDSIFKCSETLEEKGYMYTTDGLYCPLADNMYLKIGRSNNKYTYSISKYEDYTFNYISSEYSCKEAITEDKASRTKKLIEYWSKCKNTTDIKPILSTIAIDLMNEDDFAQINRPFNIYEEQQKKQSNNDGDSVDKAIEKRRKPKLNPFSLKEAEKVETKEVTSLKQ